jgi:hypothetical protein
MRSGIYSGNSPGKTIVRAESYGWLLRKLGEDRFLSGYHLVIASRDCGDIDFLLTCGVNPRHIIACDLDPVARNLAKGHGVIVSPEPSIEETVPCAVRIYGARNIASINVDLCSPLRSWGRANGAAILKSVLDETPLSTVVFFTFYRSRDGIYDRPHSLRKRLIYLRQIIGQDEIIQKAYPYQSRTRNRPVGSPFCTLILTATSTRKGMDTMSTKKNSKKPAKTTTKTVKKTVSKKPNAATKAWATRKKNAVKKSK